MRAPSAAKFTHDYVRRASEERSDGHPKKNGRAQHSRRVPVRAITDINAPDNTADYD